MSNDIRKYRTIKEGFKDAKDLELTAFVGGNKYGNAIKFTIGHEYACLSEKQLLDLIEVIIKRLACKKGFSATDWSDEKTVLPDGTIIVEKEIEDMVSEDERGMPT